MESTNKSARYMGVRIKGMPSTCRPKSAGYKSVKEVALMSAKFIYLISYVRVRACCHSFGVRISPELFSFYHFFFILAALLSESVEADECPEFPKQHSVQCPPHSAVDQCKYDADCPESGNQCCLIGCQKMCLNPKAIREAISGKRAYQY